MHLVVLSPADIRVIDHMMNQVLFVFQRIAEPQTCLTLLPGFDLSELPLVALKEAGGIKVTDILQSGMNVMVESSGETGKMLGVVSTFRAEAQTATVLAHGSKGFILVRISSA
jgi:hypothetical protein